MKFMNARAWAGATLLTLAAAAGSAQAADVGVSINISQPGVYGRIDIGRFPQPQLVVQQPVLIVRHAAPPPPVYLWVPPGHQRNWRQHCGRYRACGVPVYFVQDRWYRSEVMHRPPPPPQRGWREDRRDGRDGRGDDHGRGEGHRGGRVDHHGDHRGEGRGHRD